MTTNNAVAFTAFDATTGEILEERRLKSNEHLKVVKKLTREQHAHNMNKRQMESLSRALGGFVWVFYSNNELLFTSEELSKANVTRLMMLATYMNYDNALVHDIPTMGGSKFTNAIEYMTKKDIQQVLNLKDTMFKKFFKEVTEIGILIQRDGHYCLSSNYFHRGEVNSKRENIHCGYTRMFIHTVRQIYSGMKTTKHNLLSYVFQLIPCVHYSTNFICKDVASSYNTIEYMNIEDGMKTTKHNLLSYVFQLIPCVHYSTNFICKDVASSYNTIEYMNIEDICKYLGLSTDKKNMNKFKKELMSIHIDCNGQMAHLINEVIYNNSTTSKQRFVFNPCVVTSISQREEINNIMQSLFIG